MGLSSNYSASIKDMDLVDPVINEVEDICRSMGWDYDVWRQSDFTPIVSDIDYTPLYLNGISIENCEPVWLCFLPNKRMSSLALMAKESFDEVEWIYWISTKTQFAGPDVHIAVIKLLHYIDDKS